MLTPKKTQAKSLNTQAPQIRETLKIRQAATAYNRATLKPCFRKLTHSSKTLRLANPSPIQGKGSPMKRSLVAATLLATAVALGAASGLPAIAGAEPTQTQTPEPPRPTSPSQGPGGWDSGQYDSCMAGHSGIAPEDCCEHSGGAWHSTGIGSFNGTCSAAPQKAQ